LATQTLQIDSSGFIHDTITLSINAAKTNKNIYSKEIFANALTTNALIH